MTEARRDSASLARVRGHLARAFDLFGLGCQSDEPQLLALVQTAWTDLAEAAEPSSGSVSQFAREWMTLARAQVERLRASNRPTRVDFGTALLSLEFLVSVVDLQLARRGLPDHCLSCESPQLSAISDYATVFECLACGLRAAYPDL